MEEHSTISLRVPRASQRPKPVLVGCVLLVLDALMSGLSVYYVSAEFWGQSSRLWVSVLLPVAFSTAIAVLTYCRLSWPRYALALLAVIAIWLQATDPNFSMRWEGGDLLLYRDALSIGAWVVAAIAFFLPKVNLWFKSAI